MILGASRRHLFLVAALISYFSCAFFCIQTLTRLSGSINPSVLLIDLSLALSMLFLSIVFGWAGFKWSGLYVFLTAGIGLVVFVSVTSSTSLFLWTAVFLICFTLMLIYLAQQYEQECASLDSEREKTDDQFNDLQVSYKLRGEGISVFFEKYSTYYNLRKLAENLARILAIEEVTKLLVDQCIQFIGRGNYCTITLVQSDGGHLPVIAHKTLGAPEASMPNQEGSIYDVWVIKNRKRLIVADLHADFRFASQLPSQSDAIRSLIVTPLITEGRVIGTLGLYSRHSNTYSHDDLRLLDAIATLASSAISNSMLYERTSELAIRDSLTGLYVRRHFYSRLKEEHRRALMTKKPLALLMCDLDHFKSLNDQFGHQAGDIILTQFTDILKSQVDGALIARYGGEEFSVLLPETSKDQAQGIAEQIRKSVESAVFNLRRQEVRLTVSIGISAFPQDTLEMDALVHKADTALYAAKKQGRNRVCCAP